MDWLLSDFSTPENMVVDRQYPMTNHGFARDYEFSIGEEKQNSISLILCDSVATHQCYPFVFKFIVTYTLVGQGLQMTFRVENPSNQVDLYFSLGAHTAFNVPITPETVFETYCLNIMPHQQRRMMKLKDLQDYLIDLSATSLEETDAAISLNHEMFRKGLVVYETSGSTACALTSPQTQYSVSITYNNMPYTCIWSPPDKDAPFICIEPMLWFAGHHNCQREA